MKRNLTNTGKILQTLDRSFGLTRAELANRLGESRDTIRKTLHVMLKDGRIARVIGDDGVEIYNITDAGKTALTKELARARLSEPAPKVWKEDTSVIKLSSLTVEEAIESKMSGEELSEFVYQLNKPKNNAWATLVEEAEQRGFAKGYAEGIKTSQAQAYQDAKLDIVKKLVGVVT